MGRGVVHGLLGVHTEGFRQHLLDRGYTEGSAARLIHLMAPVSRWIDVGGLLPSELSTDQVAAFAARVGPRDTWAGGRRELWRRCWSICESWAWCRTRNLISAGSIRGPFAMRVIWSMSGGPLLQLAAPIWGWPLSFWEGCRWSARRNSVP